MGGLVSVAWRRRSVPGAVPFAVLVVAFSQFLTGIYLQFNTNLLPVKWFWVNYYQLAIFSVAAAWVMLALQVSGYEKRFRDSVLRTAIISLSLVYFVTVITYRGPFLANFREANLWIKTPRPLFWVTWIVPFFWVFFGIACLIGKYHRAAGVPRRQIGLILLGILPLVAVHGWMFWNYFICRRIPPEGIPCLFLAYVAATLIFAWVIFRGRFFEIMQLAQAEVTAKMGDCLIALDTLGYIADVNPAAEVLLGDSSRRLAGVKASEVLGFWPLLREAAASPEQRTWEGIDERDGGKLAHARAYQIETIPLANLRGRPIGKVILLHDITAWKQAQAQLLEQQKALAILAERDRLGRELHDDQGQIWSYMNMQLQIIRGLLQKGAATGAAPNATGESGAHSEGGAAASSLLEAERQLERLVDVTRDVHLTVRESIAGLKNTAAAVEEFIPTLRDHLAWFERNYGIAARLVIEDQPPAGMLSHSAGLQVLRIIQEALANVRKHARAKQVVVSIYQDEAEIKVVIADDGCGFDPGTTPEGDHYGLRIMAERAAEAGGTFTIESRPGAGTKVIVTLRKVENHETAAGG